MKVSLIIPVYNMEMYISECLESVIRQDYQDLEVIIVDDGSTDSGFELCKMYERQDGRLRVVRKRNGGLSSARNYGIDLASGDYITFLDSDDYYLNEKAVSTIAGMIESNPNAIVCFGHTTRNPISIPDRGSVKKMSREEAVSHLFDDDGYKFYAWNKAFPRETFHTLRFPEGELYEDIKTTYKSFLAAEGIVWTDIPLIRYRLREDSITKKGFSTNDYDLINAIDHVIMHATNYYKPISDRMKVGYAYYFLTFLNKAYRSGIVLADEENRLSKHTKRYLLKILGSDSLCLVHKSLVLFQGLFPHIYRVTYCNLLSRIQVLRFRSQESAGGCS